MAANVKSTKGGFVSCDCINLSRKDPPTGSDCVCRLVSDFKPGKNVGGGKAFGIRKLKGVTNVVVREGRGRR